MSRRVQDLDLGCPDFENIPIRKILMAVFHRRAFVDINIGVRGGSQFLIAADMVGMHVGIKYVGDSHPLLPGDIEIILNIPLRIHNGHRFCPGAADHIRKATQTRYRNLVEIHAVLLFRLDCAFLSAPKEAHSAGETKAFPLWARWSTPAA